MCGEQRQIVWPMAKGPAGWDITSVWETHSKHKTLSYLARIQIKVSFSAFPSFGGRGPTGRSSLKKTPLGLVHSLLPFVAFCHLFCFELVNFSIAAWTSSSWWACGGLQGINFSPGQGEKSGQACFWQHLEPSHCNVICQCCQAAMSLAQISDHSVV